MATPTYHSWLAMRSRVKDKTRWAYQFYGGRGIAICDRWDSFDNFLADMGERPEGKEIDRIDNAKGYAPDNCRWATRAEQMRNTRNNHAVTFGGRRQVVKDWAKEVGIEESTLRYRLKNWGIDRALTSAPAKTGNRALTAADVILIRSDARFQHVIAAEYGVTQTLISQVKRRIIWKDVP